MIAITTLIAIGIYFCIISEMPEPILLINPPPPEEGVGVIAPPPNGAADIMLDVRPSAVGAMGALIARVVMGVLNVDGAVGCTEGALLVNAKMPPPP